MTWWSKKKDRPVHDPSGKALVELMGEHARQLQKIASGCTSQVSSLREDLEDHKRLTTDQYNSAYARTAEGYYKSSQEELKHRQAIEKQIMERWRDNTESLKQQIVSCEQENTRLVQEIESLQRERDGLKALSDEMPRLHQIRDWLVELRQQLEEMKRGHR